MLGLAALLLQIAWGFGWSGKVAQAAHLDEPDWSAQAQLPLGGRANIYSLPETDWQRSIHQGKIHALHYPVAVTGLKMPSRTTTRLLDLEPGEPLFGFLKTLLKLQSGIQNFQGFWKWLGLQKFPAQPSSLESGVSAALPEYIPAATDRSTRYPMGVGFLSAKKQNSEAAEWVTLSCAACHSSQLFGRPVIGMTQRFPRANEFFLLGKDAIKNVHPTLFRTFTGSTKAETQLFAETRNHMRAVGLKQPQTLGLDTSLAQVALSLAKRNPDTWATRSTAYEKSPRPNLLDQLAADSKPAVWWNVKYKTRWLSDGSVLSGNPIFTNFIWNEIGRGADLPALTEWMSQNSQVIRDLTAAVFAAQAPQWQDYLGNFAPIQIERARRGEAIYQASCQKCHGGYIKDWTQGHATLQVQYHPQTFVKDVGTDPGRRQGMKALAEALNPLEVSRQNQIVIEEQTGYVPPPLEGIWARYPYFHNNSIPSLCALMTPPEQRPTTYWAGEPQVPGRDYDTDCVGYPSAQNTPPEWKKDAAFLFDTRKPGLSNSGHYDKIFRVDGVERLTPDQKRDLIEYLKTL